MVITHKWLWLMVSMLAAVVLIVFFASRKIEEPEQQGAITDSLQIDLKALRQASYADDIFLPVEEVALRGEIVGAIRTFTIRQDGSIVMLDRRDVKIFDKDGRFIRKFGRQGSGPGEIQQAADICLDDSSNIYVLDWKLTRVSVFASNGTYKRMIALDAVFDHLLINGGRVYVYGPLHMGRDWMAACYSLADGRREFQFAAPTRFLKSLVAIKFLEPMGMHGFLRSFGERIYLAHPYEYAVREFSRRGKEVTGFQGSSEAFVPIDPSRGFTIEGGLTKYITSILRVMQVWKGLVIVAFREMKSDKEYLDIYSGEGHRLNTRSLLLSGRTGGCEVSSMTIDKEGTFYFYRHPKPESNPPLDSASQEKLNPVIVKFRLKN